MEQKDIVVESLNSTFTKVLDGLLAAVSVVNTITGEEAKLKSSDKIVYAKMLAAYNFHSEAGRELFESQDSIGDSLGLEHKAVISAIKKLENIGLMSKKTTYASGLRRNYYTVLDIVDNSSFILRRRKTTRGFVNNKIVVSVEIIDFQITQNAVDCVATTNKRKAVGKRSIQTVADVQETTYDFDEINFMISQQQETGDWQAMQLGL